MRRRLAVVPVLLLLLFGFSARPCVAQGRESALSDAEVEQLRESAYVPNDRVLLFVKLPDVRASSVGELFARPRRPGREQDSRILFEQFTTIADELDDNLDDYSSHHRDVRKSLPKLLNDIERWASELKSPPDNEVYNVSRKIALEAVRDIREGAEKLVVEQEAWFAAHPAKDEQSHRREVPQ